MKKFIIRISLFLLPIFVCAVICEVLLRQIPNDYSYKKHYLDIHANKIETLILGSSHTYFGIDPVYFSTNTFNAAIFSQAPGYDMEILKLYDEKLTHLQTVVIPLAYPTLGLNRAVERWRSKNYIIYYGIILHDEPLKYYFELTSSSFNTHIERIKAYLQGYSITCTNLGWGIRYNSQDARDLEKTGKNSILGHTQNIHSLEYKEILESNIKSLNTIAEICRKHNAKLLLFTPPAYKTYYQQLDREQLDLTVKTANEIANRNSNCVYINLLTDSTFRATDYYDADHLSEIGAKKLSLLIDQYINTGKN
jgi:hypothetical protein